MIALPGAAQASICSPEQFTRWIVSARPNERIRYAEARWLPKEAMAPVLALLRASFDEGEILFFQKSLGGGQFAYFAVRRARRLRPAPVKRFVARNGAC